MRLVINCPYVAAQVDKGVVILLGDGDVLGFCDSGRCKFCTHAVEGLLVCGCGCGGMAVAAATLVDMGSVWSMSSTGAGDVTHMVAVVFVSCTHHRHGFVIFLLVLLYLLGIVVAGSKRWKIVQIFTKMTSATFTVTGFKSQIVAFLGPQIL